jgi:PBSX family phage terminase large subunit
MDININNKFPANFRYLYDFVKGKKIKNYISMVTPRSAGKSYTMGWLIILTIILIPGDILIVRKNNNTLKTSVIQECLDVIEELQLFKVFEYHKTDQWIRYIPLDRKIFFKGIDKDNIKGFKPPSGTFSICWIEEVQQLNGIEEVNVIIDTFVKNIGEHYLYIETGNGSSIRSHWINKRINDIPKDERFKIIRQDYRDISHLLNQGALDRIETLKSLDYNTYCIEYLGMYGQNSSSVYKKFDRDVVLGKIDTSKIDLIVIGVDYGDSDATTFTATAMNKEFNKIQTLKHFYHKNGVSIGLKDINDYVVDFFKFAEYMYKKYGKRMLVQVDSATLSFFTVLKRHQGKHNVHYVAIEKVVKTKRLDKKGNIESRIMLMNMMLGAGVYTINEECDNALILCESFENAERGNDGQRVDNGTSNIDSLDATEYSYNKYMKNIYNSLFRKGNDELDT